MLPIPPERQLDHADRGHRGHGGCSAGAGRDRDLVGGGVGWGDFRRSSVLRGR